MTTATQGQGTRRGGALGPLKGAWRGLLRVWDSMAIYMPLLMMGALALGTYWLVRNTPIFSTSEAPREASHDIDYFMRKFTVKTFDERASSRARSTA